MIWSFVFKYWRPVAGFLGLAVFFGWISWQSDQIRKLKKELAAAQTSVASYEESLAVLQADSTAKIQALEAEKNRQITRTRNMERLLGRIEGAGDEEDAPVAPVLRDTVERLYGDAENAD